MTACARSACAAEPRRQERAAAWSSAGVCPGLGDSARLNVIERRKRRPGTKESETGSVSGWRGLFVFERVKETAETDRLIDEHGAVSVLCFLLHINTLD